MFLSQSNSAYLLQLCKSYEPSRSSQNYNSSDIKTYIHSYLDLNSTFTLQNDLCIEHV